MDLPPNEVFKRQSKRFNPDVIRKAIISSINITSRQADIYFINNPETIIKNVPVASSVDMSNLTVGSRVKVDIFDESNPKDIVIAYSYGGGVAMPVGQTVVITYVSAVVLNNLGGGTYTLTVTTKTMTFTNGVLISHT